jgi:predicted nucleotidyltransferase
MEETLKVINSLVEKGIILGYAIGGGMAAAYFGEPTLTYDLDLFVYLPSDKDNLLTLSPIHEYLKGLSYKTKGEGVVVEGILVQFLPLMNDLVEEAYKKAIEVRYNRTRTRIISLEHLVAIMIQTFRPKDKLRLQNLLEIWNDPECRIKPDSEKLNDILTRHNLKKKWDDFIRKK